MRFISLGYDCYAKKALKKINLEGISFPFDNIITPIESLIKLLQNNFNNFLQVEQMGNPVIYYNKTYNIKFPHDNFLKMDENIKYIRRIDRFNNFFKSNDILCFIRTRDHSLNNLEKDLEYSKELFKVIKDKHEDLKFFLIYIKVVPITVNLVKIIRNIQDFNKNNTPLNEDLFSIYYNNVNLGDFDLEKRILNYNAT